MYASVQWALRKEHFFKVRKFISLFIGMKCTARAALKNQCKQYSICGENQRGVKVIFFLELIGILLKLSLVCGFEYLLNPID